MVIVRQDPPVAAYPNPVVPLLASVSGQIRTTPDAITTAIRSSLPDRDAGSHGRIGPVRADAANGDHKPAQTEDELLAIIKDLWRHLDLLREERGSPALSAIAKKAGLPRSTVSEWYQKQMVVPAWAEFTRLVQASGGQPELWRQRWRRARVAADDLRRLRAQRSRSDKPPASPTSASSVSRPEPAPGLPAEARSGPADTARPSNDGKKDPGSAVPGRAGNGESVNDALTTDILVRRVDRRLWCVVVVAAVIAAAVVFIVWQAFLARTDATVPSLLGLAPDVACAALRDVELVCGPNDNETTREVDVVHEQDHPPGAVVTKGTTVEYTYESTAPLPLRRYQAPEPDSANFISPTEPGPANWNTKPPLGWVYEEGTNSAPGLVPIYQYRCTSPICSERLVYFLSRYAGPRQNYVYEGETFRCFNPDAPPPGTRPLHPLMNDKHARIWAVPGTFEYQSATSNGYKDSPSGRRPLCYIW